MEAKTDEAVIREAKNQYHREWYKNNKDKVKAANKRYWLKKLSTSTQLEGSNGDKKN